MGRCMILECVSKDVKSEERDQEQVVGITVALKRG